MTIRLSIFLMASTILLFFSSCSDTAQESAKRVEIKKNNNGHFQFFIEDQAFELKGVGLDFTQGKNFKKLAEVGGNAFRTWRTDDADMQLDSAKKYNLMVALGLDIEKELHGFDFNDEEAVAEQLERLKKEVIAYKDHPNLLCWVAGNELNLLFDENGGLKTVNPKTYTALKDIVDFIHEVDPHHPVTTTFAGGSKEHVDLCLQHCPDLDFLSYQIYGDLGAIHDIALQAAPKIPFAVTEFGPKGHWERPVTEWGREIEESSHEKAQGFKDRYSKAFAENKSGLCLGGFAFLWGQKQERTPTWYGLLTKTGQTTSAVDELSNFWTGTYPENKAPEVYDIKIDNQISTDNVYLKPGGEYLASVPIKDPENEKLTVEWFVMTEVRTRSQGGAFEAEPERLKLQYVSEMQGQAQFIAPKEEGDYRLFVHVEDPYGHVGYSNIPFFIKK